MSCAEQDIEVGYRIVILIRFSSEAISIPSWIDSGDGVRLPQPPTRLMTPTTPHNETDTAARTRRNDSNHRRRGLCWVKSPLFC